MKYRQLNDSDARELVQLGATRCRNQDGKLPLSTNSDTVAAGEAGDSEVTPGHILRAEDEVLEPCMALTGGVEGVMGYVRLEKDVSRGKSGTWVCHSERSLSS